MKLEQLEKDLQTSVDGIVADMLVRTPEANALLIITVAKQYNERLTKIKGEENAN